MIPCKDLLEKQTKLDIRHAAVKLRTYRAISWIGYAETAQPQDIAFVCYWIAFNALYGDRRTIHTCEDLEKHSSERAVFRSFVKKMARLDRKNGERLFHLGLDSIWNQVRWLIKNNFVYDPFWINFHEPDRGTDWQQRLKEDGRKADTAEIHDAEPILLLLFDRLYVLRNQIFHGSATNQGNVNRNQVDDGTPVLANCVPLFTDIMLENPNAGWTAPYYPGRRLERDAEGRYRESDTPYGSPAT